MLVGYARVSTEDQNLDLQRQALLATGCEGIYEDHGVSGLARRRPRLDAALAEIVPGDVLVVWRLDRLGRSLSHLIETIDRLGKAGVGFRSLTEAIDTTTAGGRLILHIMGALAESERSLIVERTRAGIDAARRRGVKVGRPRKLTDHQLAHARALLDVGTETRAGVARLLGVDAKTLWRALAADDL